MAVKTDGKKPSPEAQLRSFIDRFEPKDQKLIRSIRAAVRKRFPTANELAYDYSSHVVIAYSPTEQAIDAVVAIDARAGDMRLYLMGPKLPDPKKLLMGSGKKARYVGLEAASKLGHPDVKALIAAAIEQARVPLPSKGKGEVMMRGSTATERARRRTT